MGMKPYRRAVAVTGKYTDREGREKNRYLNIGTLFKGDGEDEGRFSLKLEATPVGGDFNGWVSFFEIEDKRESAGDRSSNSGNGGGSYRAASTGGADLDDEIPF